VGVGGAAGGLEAVACGNSGDQAGGGVGGSRQCGGTARSDVLPDATVTDDNALIRRISGRSRVVERGRVGSEKLGEGIKVPEIRDIGSRSRNVGHGASFISRAASVSS